MKKATNDISRSVGHLLLVMFLLLISNFSLIVPAYAETLSVTTVILSKSNCKFNNPPTATLDFGDLNPINPADIKASATLAFVCHGSENVASFLITDDDGLYETGANANRMQHVTNPSAYLPYNLTLSPTSSSVPKNVNQTLTVTGTVYGSSYQTAATGAYSDTVTISIQP